MIPRSTFYCHKAQLKGNSLGVQWSQPGAFTAGGLGLIPGQELRSCEPRGAAKKKIQLKGCQL